MISKFVSNLIPERGRFMKRGKNNGLRLIVRMVGAWAVLLVSLAYFLGMKAVTGAIWIAIIASASLALNKFLRTYDLRLPARSRRRRMKKSKRKLRHSS